jgi:molybdopterin converting factor small subunit
MEITLYPPYRAIVGQDSLRLDVHSELTLRQLLTLLAECYPAFREYLDVPSDEFLWGQLIVHVNDDIVGMNGRIRPGDRVDLLPPISGG